MKKLFILSVGGSLIAPDEPDTLYLKQLRAFLQQQTRRGHRFILVVGGGQTCRTYLKSARKLRKNAGEDFDWIGIRATRLNAELVRVALGSLAHPVIVDNPAKPPRFREKVLVAAGWKPGWSTDYDSVLLARKLGVEAIYNLTNVDYIYERDPKFFPRAKRFTQLTWRQYLRLLPRWKAGLHAPFDPVASREAQHGQLTLHCVNGRKLPNLARALEGKPFKGTTITPP